MAGMLRALVLSLACGAAIGARSGLVGRPRFTPRPASVAQRTREAARPTPLSVAAPRARCAARAAVGAASEQVGELASSLMAEVVEVNRARIRLEGLNAYAVIAALIMNSALRIFTTTCVPGARVDSSLERAISILVLLASTVSILAGSYTTVVFTLVGLYAKTALGRQMDAAYIEFFARTVCYRQVRERIRQRGRRARGRDPRDARYIGRE